MAMVRMVLAELSHLVLHNKELRIHHCVYSFSLTLVMIVVDFRTVALIRALISEVTLWWRCGAEEGCEGFSKQRFQSQSRHVKHFQLLHTSLCKRPLPICDYNQSYWANLVGSYMGTSRHTMSSEHPNWITVRSWKHFHILQLTLFPLWSSNGR